MKLNSLAPRMAFYPPAGQRSCPYMQWRSNASRLDDLPPVRQTYNGCVAKFNSTGARVALFCYAPGCCTGSAIWSRAVVWRWMVHDGLHGVSDTGNARVLRLDSTSGAQTAIYFETSAAAGRSGRCDVAIDSGGPSLL